MRPDLPRRSPLPLVLAFALAPAALGCGGGDAGPPIHPVSGLVRVDGRPAAQARVTFHRLGGPPTVAVPYAVADAEGAFRPSTRLTGDGAPAGEYALTVVWPEIRVDHGEEVAGRDRLGGRYGNPQTSPLKATIRAGENPLPPLDLKSR